MDYLTTKETAQALGVAERTIRDWIKQGKIEAQKFGRSWMIHKSALDNPPEKGEFPSRYFEKNPAWREE